MGDQAIQVAVRVRPLTESEAARIPEATHSPSYMGDGALSGVNPERNSPGIAGYGGPGNVMREVVQVLDDSTLVFDPPDKNAFSRAFLNGTLPGPERRNAGRPAPSANGQRTETYHFDNVFDKDATQEQVYTQAVKPMLDGLFEGYNATVFAYGATGCGKTHTISGTDSDPGVIYRVMNDLFAMREASAHEFETHVSFSALEIYNEKIYDLLVEGQTRSLFLREDGKNRIVVANLSSKQPQNAQEVLDYVVQANGRRKQSPTHANANSSRSHAIIQISIARTRRGGAVTNFERETITSTSTTSTLSIIDLAGSERASATQNMGKRMMEGANINKSLLELANVLSALSLLATQPKRRGRACHVPYRNSVLTRLLQFSLGGNCRTLMIACVAPCSLNKEDISNTLKYAARAMTISTSVTQNSHEGQRNIRQFLETIAAQNATIAELTQTINVLKATSPAGVQENLDKHRAEMSQARRDMQQHAQRDSPFLIAAAHAQAKNEVADVVIAALRDRLSAINQAYPAGSSVPEEVDATRKAIKAEIRKADGTRHQGPEFDAGDRAQNHLDGMLRALRCQSFGKLDKEEKVVVDVEARLCIAEVEKAKVAARAEEYRSSLATQARSGAAQLDALAKCTASLQVAARELESAAAGDSDESLEARIKRIAAGLVSVARTGEAVLAGSDAPATAQPIIAPHRPVSAPSRRLSTAPLAAAAPARPRQSIRGGLMAPVMPTIRASPVNKRIASLSQVGTPKRAIHSPRKRASAMPGSARVRLGSAKKHMTWKDEAGSGRGGPLESFRTITPDSTVSNVSPQIVSTSPEGESSDPSADDEWQEEDEPAGAATANTASLPAIRLPTAGEPSIPQVSVEPIPEWKKNRLMMGKASSLLGALADTSAADTSLLRASTSMGPPQRPAGPSSVLASGAQRSVPSSAARRPPVVSQEAASNASFSQPQSSSRLGLGRPAQRRPSIGPIRHERKRSRSSILPIAEEGDESGMLSTMLSPRQVSAGSASHPRLSLVSEGKQRAASLGRSPKKAGRRLSTMGHSSALSGAAKPRQSISGMAGKLPKALATMGSPPASLRAADVSMISPPAAVRPVSSMGTSTTARTSPSTMTGALAPLRGPPASLRKFPSMASLSTTSAGGENGAAMKPIWR